MLIKFGGIAVDARGSMAGNVFSRSRFGNYVRARTKPVNPKSPRQVAARTNVMFLAEQWREAPMTDLIRAAWETYANSVIWNNKLGESVTLTGFNHFIRSNAALLTLGATIVTAAPTDLGLPAGDPTFNMTAVSAALQSAIINFDDTFTWCDEDDAYFTVQMGLPQNATRNFFNGPWRWWTDIPGNLAVPPVDPIGPVANLPYPLVEGQKVWWRAAIIRADARMSTKFEATPTIVVA